jgi:hypothetical protein
VRKCLVIENTRLVIEDATRDNVYLFCPRPQPSNPIDSLLCKSHRLVSAIQPDMVVRHSARSESDYASRASSVGPRQIVLLAMSSPEEAL